MIVTISNWKGEDLEIKVTNDSGYESDTNARIVEWIASDKSPEWHNELTDNELQELHNRICDIIDEYESYSDYDDRYD